MRGILKILVATVTIFSNLYCDAAEKNEIILTVTADGTTKDEAIKEALRMAIEQTYGAFVSSNTDLLNDEIVKDEIATVSSGNIKKYKELSSIVLPTGNTSVTLEATVSVSKLISYAHSKGAECEFDGQSLVADLELQQLYIKNEETAIENILKQMKLMLKDGFDYNVTVGNINFDQEENSWFYGSNYASRETKYNGNVVIIPFKIQALLNKTGKDAFYYLYDMIGQLAEKEPSSEERENLQENAAKELEQYIKKEDKNIKKAFKIWKEQNELLLHERYLGQENEYVLYYQYITDVWKKENIDIVRSIYAAQGLNEDGYPLCYQNLKNSWDYLLPTMEIINAEIKSRQRNRHMAKGNVPDPHRLFFKSQNSVRLLDEFFRNDINPLLSNYTITIDDGANTVIDRNGIDERFAISSYSQTNGHLPIIKEGAKFYFSTGTIKVPTEEVKKIRKIQVVKN